VGLGELAASCPEYGRSSVEASGDYSADGRRTCCRHDLCMILVLEAGSQMHLTKEADVKGKGSREQPRCVP